MLICGERILGEERLSVTSRDLQVRIESIDKNPSTTAVSDLSALMTPGFSDVNGISNTFPGSAKGIFLNPFVSEVVIRSGLCVKGPERLCRSDAGKENTVYALNKIRDSLMPT